ncbi:TIGR01906 family membrane protein [Nicoliella lavandulae]|uniref:TIGR01906 family membrane protein n=1 Tax=Nicoliella lavandulae TaxID=3082954 RepID=A0ABU8SKL3_9LACO
MRINWQAYLLCIIFEIFFISFSIMIVANATFLYQLNIRWLHLVQATGVSADAIMADYRRVIDYLQNPLINQLDLHSFKSSPDGIEHFRDVKRLLLFNELVALISGVASIWSLIYNFSRNRLWQFLIPIKVMLTSLAVFVTLVLINFQSSFIMFHKLFFRNRDWVFNPNHDPIILALPIEFFLQLLLFIIGLVLIFNLILYWLGLISLRPKNKG